MIQGSVLRYAPHNPNKAPSQYKGMNISGLGSNTVNVNTVEPVITNIADHISNQNAN